MWNDSRDRSIERYWFIYKEEAGDSLEEGEAPEDTIENVDKHKCSEIELELLTVFVQTIV